MKIVNVYQLEPYKDPVHLARIEINNESKKKWNEKETLKYIREKQKKEDILHLGKPRVISDFGIMELYHDNGVSRTWDIDSSMQFFYPVTFEDGNENEPPLYLGFEFYPVGYVIYCYPPGEEPEDEDSRYFWVSYITPADPEAPIRMVRERNRAKIWVTPPYILEWCELHIEGIENLKEKGWHFRMDYHNALSQKEREASYQSFRLAKRKTIDDMERQIREILSQPSGDDHKYVNDLILYQEY